MKREKNKGKKRKKDEKEITKGGAERHKDGKVIGTGDENLFCLLYLWKVTLLRLKTHDTVKP